MPRDALDRLEGAAARRVLRLLREARERVTAILSDGYRPRGESPSDYDESYARARKGALDREITRLEDELHREVEAAVRESSRSAQTFIAKAAGLPVVVDSRVVDYALQSAADEVRAVADSARTALRRSVTRAVAGGISHSEMVSEIRDALGPQGSAARVERIARTEVNRAYQQQRAALDEQLSDSGSDLIKRWESQLDDRVRETHLEIHGQERELTDLFNVGLGATDATPPKSGAGYKANGPLDPSLPAEEAINCRCDVVYVDRSEAGQPYIRKRQKVKRPEGIGRIRVGAARVLSTAARLLSGVDARRILAGPERRDGGSSGGEKPGR